MDSRRGMWCWECGDVVSGKRGTWCRESGKGGRGYLAGSTTVEHLPSREILGWGVRHGSVLAVDGIDVLHALAQALRPLRVPHCPNSDIASSALGIAQRLLWECTCLRARQRFLDIEGLGLPWLLERGPFLPVLWRPRAPVHAPVGRDGGARAARTPKDVAERRPLPPRTTALIPEPVFLERC